MDMNLSIDYCLADYLSNNYVLKSKNNIESGVKHHLINQSFSVKPFLKQTLVSTCLQYKSEENSVGKGEIARNEQFLLFPQCFLL